MITIDFSFSRVILHYQAWVDSSLLYGFARSLQVSVFSRSRRALEFVPRSVTAVRITMYLRFTGQSLEVRFLLQHRHLCHGVDIRYYQRHSRCLSCV